jgi:acyl-coenzyme A synthetase/AMP-(fatty) acid ligase
MITTAGLIDAGVGQGDRVVAYAPNCPETLAMFLAAASLGGDLVVVLAGVWGTGGP